jgi:hypothetical protein
MGLGDEITKSYEKGDTRHMSDIVISRSDGDILRGGQGMGPEETTLLKNTVAMTALLVTSTDDRPVWLDIDNGHGRLVAVAFDDEFVFVGIGELDTSRAAFIEEARELYGD